jgi:hypothetical protein
MSNAVKKIAPPPPRRTGRLTAVPPRQSEAPDNLTKPTDVDAIQDMNFKVKPEFHTSFKTEAVLRGMSMKEMLEAAFRCYLDVNGSKLNASK